MRFLNESILLNVSLGKKFYVLENDNSKFWYEWTNDLKYLINGTIFLIEVYAIITFHKVKSMADDKSI